MSFYTDFIIAAETEAPDVAVAEMPTDLWPGFSVKNITALDLANFWSLLSDEADPVVLHDRFDHLCFDEEARQAVSLVPRPLLELMSALLDPDMPGLAARWAQAEEFRGMTDHSHLVDLLRNLRGLARRAQGERKDVLVCISGF